MNGVSEEFLTELKARSDIVDVIGSYISFTKRNGEDYWACCPFHHENTPSFVVHRSDQYYHCFGCGVSGSVINFVQKYESLSFMEAVGLLAKKAGIEVPAMSGADAEEAAKRKKQKDAAEKIMLATAKFYRSNLYSGKAERHVEYLINRGIQPSTIKKFGFGASPDFDSLPSFLYDSGFQKDDILRAGVCSANKSGRLYDFEAERVIVPIINAMDEVIAFGGRLLDVKSGMGKYKNTRETILFNKSRTLFNLNMIKRLKQEKRIDNLIMVEGYMDAITLYQAGFKNVVASMGTSLTPDQARMVKRYSENVLVSYDGDAAGRHANLRGMEIFRRAGLNVKVVPLPEGEDPDDVIRRHGPELYSECLSKAMPLVDYKIYSLDRRYDISKSEEKREYASEALKVIKAESESTVREELLQNLSRKTGYSVKALSDDLSSAAPPPEEKDDVAQKTSRSPEWAKGLPKNVVDSTRFLLAAKLFNMPYAKDYSINPDMFMSDVQRKIAGFIVKSEESGQKIKASNLLDIIPDDDEELSAIFDLAVDNKLFGANADRYFSDCVRTLDTDILKARLAEVNKQIEACTDKDDRRALIETLASLTKRLAKR